MSKLKNSSAYYYLLVKAHHVVSSEYTWARVTCLKTCLKVSQLYSAISLKTRLVWFHGQFPPLTRCLMVLETLSDPQHKLFYIYLCSGPLWHSHLCSKTWIAVFAQLKNNKQHSKQVSFFGFHHARKLLIHIYRVVLYLYCHLISV